MVNIIIADDDISSCRMIAKLLKNEVEEIENVYTAKNGEEVMALIKEHDIDIVISDVRMPVMDGIEMARQIREGSSNICIILISAYTEFEYAREAIRYGVSDYIIKPIDREELERLKKIIYMYSEKAEDNRNFQLFLHENNFRRDVKNALKNHDIDYIYGILDEIDMINVNFVLVKELVFSVIEGLFDYIEELDFAAIGHSKENTIKKVASLKNADDCILVVGELINDFTQFEQKPTLPDAAEAVKKILDAEYDNKHLNVNEIADKLGISRVYLGVLFKKEYNISIKDYMLLKRMDYACRLLKTTNHSITKIAEMLGYTDATGFRKIFKKHTGMLPNQYREELSEGGVE